MKITNIEAEAIGYSDEDLFIIAFYELDYLTSELLKIYGSNAIDEIDSYIIKFVRKVLDTLETIFLIYNNNMDYVSACSLCRNVADNLATLNLIYSTSDQNEKEFRHYLYVLDGIKCRNKEHHLSKPIINNGSIKENEFIQLKNQVEKQRSTDQKVMLFIYNKLNNSLYFEKESSSILKKIIESSNWKYKNLTQENMRQNKHSWNDLYYLIHKDNQYANFLNYLSVFVHGLSVSNLAIEKTSDLFGSILNLSITFMHDLLKLVKTIFSQEISLYNIDVKKTNLIFAMLEMITEEYKKKMWNEIQKKNIQ